MYVVYVCISIYIFMFMYMHEYIYIYTYITYIYLSISIYTFKVGSCADTKDFCKVTSPSASPSELICFDGAVQAASPSQLQGSCAFEPQNSLRLKLTAIFSEIIGLMGALRLVSPHWGLSGPSWGHWGPLGPI